jgi:glucosamine-6-phosphate deaminase
MPWKILVTRDFDHMSDVAAELTIHSVQALQNEKKEVVLGLATGNSLTGLYRRLAAAANAGQLESARWRTFNIDEYIGLPGENPQQRAIHPESYCFFMIESLFGLLEKKPIETNVPWGNLIDQPKLVHELETCTQDWGTEGVSKGKAILIKEDAQSHFLQWIRREILEAYPRKIRKYGGIDLQIIGVGGIGHVAFHEAGIPFSCKGVLLVELDRVTREHAVEDGHFTSLQESPRYAVSMSCDLVFQAASIVLLANGPRKSEAVFRSVLEEASHEVPLSYSQKYVDQGGELTYVIDQAAARDLLRQESLVKRRGIELIDLRQN